MGRKDGRKNMHYCNEKEHFEPIHKNKKKRKLRKKRLVLQKWGLLNKKWDTTTKKRL
jgi:hypothetical protein